MRRAMDHRHRRRRRSPSRSPGSPRTSGCSSSPPCAVAGDRHARPEPADRLQRPDLARPRRVHGHRRLHRGRSSCATRGCRTRSCSSSTFLICFVVGALIGIPALRLPGTSLALITLALALAFPQVLKKYGALSGGVQGISTPPDRQFNSPWDSLTNDQFRYLFCVGRRDHHVLAGLEPRPRPLGPGDDVGPRQPGLGGVDGRQPGLARRSPRSASAPATPGVGGALYMMIVRLHQPRPAWALALSIEPAHRHRRRRPRHDRRRRHRRPVRAVPAVLLERDLAVGPRPSSTA